MRAEIFLTGKIEGKNETVKKKKNNMPLSRV